MIYLIYAVLICIILFFVFKFLNKFKVPKLNSLVMVTGGVKCGKSTLSVHMAISTYKSNCRKTKIKNFFRKLFKKPLLEMPLLYSNVPLAIKYVPITRDMLLRKVRFVYGSVVYIQEASLMADSQLIKDKELNNQLLLFFKLFGHESKGGTCILDTQCISDVHYSLKRSLSEYFYVHHLVKWIPFFLVAYVVEDRYSDDGTIITTETKDTEDNLKRVIIPKRTWKYFDCYSYSVLTDDLKVNTNIVNNNLQTKDLKAYKIVSFRDEFNVEKERIVNEKENN
ncbi:MAG: hypothetical protein E7361_03150 [Clostridiales bacterium]|nr:hypothetical protein [Clostridiales bacterium]